MKYTIPTLETDRLILKRGPLEDYLKVYEFDFRYLREINGENERVKCDPELIKDFPNIGDAEYTLEFIIYEKDGNPVGNICFDRYREKYNSLEVALNIHPDYWGKGYAKEAIVAIMKYIFDNLGIDNIIYGYALENKKSKRVAEKIGFEPLRRFVEHYTRIDKDVESEECIMSKEKFYELYGAKTK